MLLPFLTSFGLTPQEAEIYELLLQSGEASISEILPRLEIKRPTLYKTLYSLEAKGFVRHGDKNKKIHFQPMSPEEISDQAEIKLREAERAKKTLDTLLPSLIASYTISLKRPVVRVMEGMEGMRTARHEILSQKLPISSYIAVYSGRGLASFEQKYHRERKQKKVFTRVIRPNSPGTIGYKENDSKEYRETRLVPEEEFKIEAEMDICGNKVAYFSEENGQIFTTIVTNKQIAHLEQAVFDLVWDKIDSHIALRLFD